MKDVNQKIYAELERILGSDRVLSTSEDLRPHLENSFAIEREVFALVFPQNTAEVQELVLLANRYSIPLHPLSRGRNIGYGEKIPISDGQIIVSLEQMQKVLSFDRTRGHVTIEAGISQQGLFQYFNQNHPDFMIDVTGAPLDTSIVGVNLEGGYGSTPLGNRRRQIVSLQAVLGTGELFDTEIFPSLGPNLAEAFVQSNFGIITSMTISVMKKPECIDSFLVRLKDASNLNVFLEVLSDLKRDGIVASPVRIANPTRAVITTRDFDEVWGKDEIMTEEDAVEILNKGTLKPGSWNAWGAICGSKAEIREKKKTNF